MSTHSYTSDIEGSVYSGAGMGISDDSVTSAPGLNQRMALMSTAVDNSRQQSNAYLVASHPDFHGGWSGMSNASKQNRHCFPTPESLRGPPRHANDVEYVVTHPALTKMIDLPKLLAGPLSSEDVTPMIASFTEGPVWTCPHCGMKEVDARHPDIESLKSLCGDPHHPGVIAHTSVTAPEVLLPNVSPPRLPIEPMLLWNAIGVPPGRSTLFKPGRGGRKSVRETIKGGIQNEHTLLDTEIPSDAFAAHENPRQSFVDNVAAHYPPWVVDMLPGHSPDDQIPSWVQYSGNCANGDAEQCCWLHCQWMHIANRGAALGLHWDMLALQAVMGDASRAIDQLDAQSFVVDQLRLHQMRDSHKGMFSEKDYSTWDKSKAAYTRYRQYTLREHINLQSGDIHVVKGWTEYDPNTLIRYGHTTEHPHINHMVFTEVDAVNLVCAGKEKVMAILWVDYAPRYHTHFHPTPSNPPIFILPPQCDPWAR
jgi:hypothetical protein